MVQQSTKTARIKRIATDAQIKVISALVAKKIATDARIKSY